MAKAKTKKKGGTTGISSPRASPHIPPQKAPPDNFDTQGGRPSAKRPWAIPKTLGGKGFPPVSSYSLGELNGKHCRNDMGPSHGKASLVESKSLSELSKKRQRANTGFARDEAPPAVVSKSQGGPNVQYRRAIPHDNPPPDESENVGEPSRKRHRVGAGTTHGKAPPVSSYNQGGSSGKHRGLNPGTSHGNAPPAEPKNLGEASARHRGPIPQARYGNAPFVSSYSQGGPRGEHRRPIPPAPHGKGPQPGSAYSRGESGGRYRELNPRTYGNAPPVRSYSQGGPGGEHHRPSPRAPHGNALPIVSNNQGEPSNKRLKRRSRGKRSKNRHQASEEAQSEHNMFSPVAVAAASVFAGQSSPKDNHISKKHRDKNSKRRKRKSTLQQVPESGTEAEEVENSPEPQVEIPNTHLEKPRSKKRKVKKVDQATQTTSTSFRSKVVVETCHVGTQTEEPMTASKLKSKKKRDGSRGSSSSSFSSSSSSSSSSPSPSSSEHSSNYTTYWGDDDDSCADQRDVRERWEEWPRYEDWNVFAELDGDFYGQDDFDPPDYGDNDMSEEALRHL